MAVERKIAADTNSVVRDMINEWAVAVRSKNIDAVMSHYASDVVVFDVAEPLEFKGTDLLRQRWAE